MRGIQFEGSSRKAELDLTKMQRVKSAVPLLLTKLDCWLNIAVPILGSSESGQNEEKQPELQSCASQMGGAGLKSKDGSMREIPDQLQPRRQLWQARDAL